MADEPEVAGAENEKPDEWWTALEAVKKDTTTSLTAMRQLLERTRADVASIQLPPATIVQARASLWASPLRPWWAPDAQGMLAIAIIAMTTSALHIRMLHATTIEDKLLDTMITILFSTCLVTVYQYTFGSSRGSSQKDEAQTKMIEKLAPAVPVEVTK